MIYFLANLIDKHTTEVYILKSLVELGEPVIMLDENSFRSDQIFRQLKDDDILMFAKGRLKDGLPGLLTLLRNFKGMKVFWLFDKMYDFRPERAEWMDKVAPLVDIGFVTDGSAIEHYQKAGLNYRILRQGVYENFIGVNKPEYWKFKTAFIGSVYYPEREEMIKEVAKEFPLLLSGHSDMYEVRGQNLADLCETIPIILGDNYKNADNYWSNRIYEILGAGGFLITPYVKGMEEEFEDGIHYVSYEYGNFSQLKEKIRYYLEHQDERDKIREAGRKHVWARFTYKQRVKQLLKEIKEYEQELHSRREGAENPEKVLDQGQEQAPVLPA